MDFIDESFGAQTTPVTMDDLVATPIAPSLPIGAIRNRAATTALLTNEPEKALENYQLLVKEGEEGGNVVYDQLKGSILESTAKVDMQGIMSVLGDSTVSMDEKRKVVEGLKGSQFLKDTNVTLFTNSLAKPSQGENYSEEASRISAADSVREINNSSVRRQGLVNAHAASMDSVSIGTLGDMISLDVLPGGTGASALSVQQAQKAVTGEKLSLWDIVKSFAAPGHSKEQAYERLKNVPPAKREALAQAFLAEINNHNGTVFGADSQFQQVRLAQEAFTDGGYTDADKWIDTVSGLADIVGLGWAFRSASRVKKVEKAAEQATTADKVFPAQWEVVDDRPMKKPQQALPNAQLRIGVNDEIERLERNSVVRRENPASPASTVQQVNPEQARNLHAAVVKSTTDEVAEALYGTSKTQAVVNDVFPQAATESGAVTAKVGDMDRNLRRELQVDEDVVDMIHDSGAIYYSNAEKAAARANVVNDFSKVEGLTINNAESSFSAQGGRIHIAAMYGTDEGGFLTAQDAIEQAKFALRNTGVREDNITLMVKQGLDYIPTTLAEQVGKQGSYKIRISTFHEIDPTDITKTVDGKTISAFDTLTHKRNWLDSLGGTVAQDTGSLSRWIFDAASMVDPRLSGAATVATDQSSRFEKLMFHLASDFSDQFLKLDKAGKAKVDNYIREANYNRIKYDEIDLKHGRGFTDAEVDTMRSWKNFWDNHYYLENYDVVRTLNSQGFQLFKNSNAELYAKPITKNQNIGWFYDPSVDDVVRWGQGEGDVLYAAGGTYAKLRRPTTFNGVEVEHMIIRNTPTEYARKLRDTDIVLPYRDGYFQLQYKKNAKFIDEIQRDTTGKVTGRKTVAVAGDTAEAMSFMRRTAQAAGKTEADYVVRGDANGLRRGGDEWWDLNSASGRIAQKHRGKLLEDASGANHLGDGSYVLNPVDSAVRASRSIAGRTVNRPMLEAAKARYVNQHAAVLGDNGFGGKAFPRSVDEISAKGEATSKAVRDARTDYEYIHYLENGYINNMDEFFKQGLNAIATAVGSVIKKTPSGVTQKSLAAVERGLLGASEVTISGTLKGGVFTATIVSNIFRQWIMQPHQVMRTWSYNPVGWASGAIPQLVTGFLGRGMGMTKFQGVLAKGTSLAGKVAGIKPHTLNIDDFVDFMDNSGLFASVDKSNLVRGTLLDAADSGNAVSQKVAKYTTTPARMIGFDAGEMANLLGHAAAVYERRVRLGGDLKDLAQRDEAYSEIRAISGEMNFAGDMPYNQTTPALLTQFLQVPQKMMLQITNRRIEPAVRARMAAMDLVMWGSPIAAIGAMMGKDILPDNPFQREVFLWGLESAVLNNGLTKLAGRDIDIDWSSFAPGGIDGWSRMMYALFTGGPEKAIITSPAGQMFLKDGGRVQNAISHMSRFFGMGQEIDETPETAIQVVKEVANVLSGVSNYNKMMMILDTKQLVDKSGKVVARDLDTIEAITQLFGFGPSAPRDFYAAVQDLQKDPKKHKEAVLKDYAAAVQYYTTTTDMSNEDMEWKDKVVGAMLRMHKNDPVAMKIIQQQLARDLQDRDATLHKLFLKRIELGFPSLGGLSDSIEKMPVPEEDKVKMRDIKKTFEEAFANDNEGN